jgi:hypothetical protein
LAARAAKVLERTANRLEADLQAGRLWPGKKTAPKPTSPEYEAAKARIEDLRATRDDLRAQQDPNRAYRQSLEKRLAELQERIDNKDFAPKSVRKERQLSADERDLLYEYDQTKQKFREMQEDWRWDQRTKVGKVVGQAANTLHASRAVITAFDASAVGRQGGFAAMAHPVLAGKAAAKMVRTLTKKGDFAVAEELRSRGNYQNGLYAKAKLALTGIVGPAHEEVYAGRWTKKIPGVAVSERIYRSFLNCLRAEMFDAMIGGRTFKGTASIEEARAVAAFVNAATGRGGLGVLEVASKPLAEVFFAPRFVVSRFQLIASPFLGFYAGKGTSLRVRRAVATEYARTLTTAAMMYGMVTLAGALFYDDKDRNKPRVTFDPRSSDFGKIVIGKTRLDPLGGLSQATVLLARTIKGETRPIGTRKVVALRGKKRPFGSPTWVDVVVKFGRSKLSPAAGMAINWQQGENLIGESVTYGSMLGEATIPLSFRDIYEAMQDQGVPKGAALGLISLFGVGLQTYQPRRHKRPARR